MADFACKNCGAMITAAPGQTEGVCPVCGTRQALREEEAILQIFNMPQSAPRKSSALAAFYAEIFEDEENDAYWDDIAALNRAFLLLEDAQWEEADKAFNALLKASPESAQAHLGKLLAHLHCPNKAALASLEQTFDEEPLYRALLPYADEALKKELAAYNEAILHRADTAQLQQRLYEEALSAKNKAFNETTFLSAAALFEQLGEYEDAPALREQCLEQAEIYRKDNLYFAAKSSLENGSVHDLETAIASLESILDWKDAEALLIECLQKKAAIDARLEKANALAREKSEAAELLEEKQARKKRNIMISLIVGSSTMFIAFILVLALVIIPTQKYKKALSDIESGNIVAAYEALAALDDYRDSAALAENIFEEYKPAKLKVAAIGDKVYFGHYYQDAAGNDKKDIAWQVLDKKDNRLLLISEVGLDCKPFHSEYADTTWENCSLRKWLNSDFIQDAFTPEEQAKIPPVKVSADPNPDYTTNPGKDTEDKVFILSAVEATRYFPTDEQRICSASDYAVSKGSYINGEFTSAGYSCWWLLRTPGSEPIYMTYIHFNGSIGYFGGSVAAEIGAIRPVLWVETN